MNAFKYISPLLALSCATVCCAQQPPIPIAPPPMVPMFSPSEITTVMNYWHTPNRFQELPPEDASKTGLFRPHLTVQGSTWLLNYERSTRTIAAPTENSLQNGSPQTGWNAWIKAKFAYDYAQAELVAKEYNSLAGDPTPDKGIDVGAPAPGLCPPGLAAIAGDPPALAAAEPIHEYKIHFDDCDLTYFDHVAVPPQYPYYRFDAGINSEGTAVTEMSQDRVDHLYRVAGIDPTIEAAFSAVSALEGGFDAVNTYDTGFVSVGFIQFASLTEGGGSLGTMLITYKIKDPNDFQRDLRQYGIDVTANGLLAAIDPLTGVEVQGPDANAEIIREPRLLAVFQRAGLKSDSFDAAQITSAVLQFYPVNDMIPITLQSGPTSIRVGDMIHSEAGMATLTDRKINTGKITYLSTVLSQVAAEHNLTNANDLSLYELEVIQKMRYRKNYLKDSNLTQPPAMPNKSQSSS